MRKEPGKGLWGRFFLVAGLLGFLCACTSELKTNLDQNQADEILVVLESQGIHADKKATLINRETKYLVTVSRADLSNARRILVIHRLPKSRMADMMAICGGEEQPLIPSPQMDRCKFIVATQNELIKQLHLLPRVVEAHVVLNIPEKDILSEVEPQPTASVVVVFIPDERGQAPVDPKEIKRQVAHGVDGLDYNDVEVILAPADSFSGKNALTSVNPSLTHKIQGKEEKAPEKPPVEKVVSEELDNASAKSVTTILGVEVSPYSSKKLRLIILFGSVVLVIMAGGAITAVLYSRNLKAENDQLKKRERNMRLNAQKALKAAPTSLARTGEGVQGPAPAGQRPSIRRPTFAGGPTQNPEGSGVSEANPQESFSNNQFQSGLGVQ